MLRLETELREMLVYSAPPEFGAIWSEFEIMRDKIKTERAEIQRLELYKQRAAKSRQANIKRKIAEQMTSILAALFIIMWFLCLMILIRTSHTYRLLYSSPSLLCALC